ncbi:MAG: sugar ABC transporter permease [Clostridiales bacterium]|nr:sugar ABC transporter permease [Clostridiales bacterium]
MNEVEVKKENKRILVNRKLRKNLFLTALLIYPILQFLLCWVYVNFETIMLTVQRWDRFSQSYVFYGFERYAKFFSQMVAGSYNGVSTTAMRNIWLNSYHGVAINIILLPIAVVTAYSFYKKVPGEKIFRVLFYLPSIISLVVLTMVYRYMFNGEYGPVAQILYGIMGKEVSFLDASKDYLWPLIYVFCIWAGLGSNVILMSGAMLRIPRDVTEALELDGCGFWRELVTIVLPLIMPTVSIFALMAVMSGATFQIQPMLIAVSVGPESKYETVAWFIYNTTKNGSQGDIVNAATVGIVFTILTLPLILLTKWLMDKLTPNVSF